jgi:hypothetical protein
MEVFMKRFYIFSLLLLSFTLFSQELFNYEGVPDQTTREIKSFLGENPELYSTVKSLYPTANLPVSKVLAEIAKQYGNSDLDFTDPEVWVIEKDNILQRDSWAQALTPYGYIAYDKMPSFLSPYLEEPEVVSVVDWNVVLSGPVQTVQKSWMVGVGTEQYVIKSEYDLLAGKVEELELKLFWLAGQVSGLIERIKKLEEEEN